jgi:hypothetical protein
MFSSLASSPVPKISKQFFHRNIKMKHFSPSSSVLYVQHIFTPSYETQLPPQYYMCGEISGSHGGVYEDGFWDVALCSLVEVYRRFRGAYCTDYGGSRHL